MIRRIVVAVQVVLLALVSQWAVGQTTIENARVWPATDHTRLVLETSGEVSHTLFALESPDRLVVDIDQTELDYDLTDLDFSDTPVESIRSGAREDGTLRVVLDMKSDVTPRSFALQPNQQYGHRLVIDMKDSSSEREKEQQAVLEEHGGDDKRDIIVVVDPGHGGEDPGAIGPSGVQEKDVALAIGEQVVEGISEMDGYQAYSTRNDDYYVGLRQRVEMARDYNADLFVSIHADAFPSEQPSGASVFALSTDGASSETASWLAERENRSDLVGGVGGVSLNDKDDMLAGVLLDLSMTASIQYSMGVGRNVLSELSGVGDLHKSSVEQAGFAVLKSPDIPSILVEAGFMSNPTDEMLLSSISYQQRQADAIVEGVSHHFEDSPPPGTLIAHRQRNGAGSSDGAGSSGGAERYEIQSGDTLSSIARQKQTSVSRIKEVNDLSSETLSVGQVIRIPTS